MKRRPGGRSNTSDLSFDERTAIAALVQYHMVVSAQEGRDRYPHGDIGAAASGFEALFAGKLKDVTDAARRRAELKKLASPVVTNIIANGAQLGARELIDHYRDLTKQAEGPFADAPRHVQAARLFPVS